MPHVITIRFLLMPKIPVFLLLLLLLLLFIFVYEDSVLYSHFCPSLLLPSQNYLHNYVILRLYTNVLISIYIISLEVFNLSIATAQMGCV